MMRFIKIVGFLALVPAVVFSIFGLFSEHHLFFDLASHFRVHYGVAAFVAALFFLICRARMWGLFSIVLLIFNLTFLIPWYFEDRVDASKDNITLFVNNVLAGNNDYQKFLSLIKTENPDIVAVIELSQSWVDALSVLKQDYPYSKLVPRPDNFGVGVYSKFPVKSESIEYFGTSATPSIVLAAETTIGDITLIATHPLPPIGNAYFKSRNEELSGIAEEIENISGPIIVAGDLNTTMWSQHYKRLEQGGKLRNARRGFGIGASWPSRLGFFGIPIDHVLVSKEIAVSGFKIGSTVGSDHLPLIVELTNTDADSHEK